MNIYIVCAWYEVGMRPYCFTILNNIKNNLPTNHNINVTLVLRDDVFNYPELNELGALNIDFLVIKNKYINILSKVFPVFFDKYIEIKVRKNNVQLLYIVYEGLFFKSINRLKKYCKVLYTVHDLIPHEKNLQTFQERWLSKTENKRTRDLLENSDYILTNFYSQYQHIKNVLHKSVFYTNMPTLVNTHIANGNITPPELKATYDYILFFGRIDKYKGVDNLIKCHIESKSHLKLIIAGSGKFWFDLPNTDNVIFINRYIDDGELKSLFTHALVCVLPYTTITQTALISMPFYFQCAVMLSNIKEFVLVAEKSGSVICDFGNYEQYGKLIRTLETDVLYRQSIINKQNSFYNSNYDSKNFMTNLTEIFKTIENDAIK